MPRKTLERLTPDAGISRYADFAPLPRRFLRVRSLACSRSQVASNSAVFVSVTYFGVTQTLMQAITSTSDR